MEPEVSPSGARLKELLRPMALRCNWWMPPEEAVLEPDRVIAPLLE